MNRVAHYFTDRRIDCEGPKPAPTEPLLRVQIRWLIRRDMEEVLEIERASFERPWGEDDFVQQLRQRNCIGLVAEHNHVIVGFVIYELHKSKLRILSLAVAPSVRRRGIGRQMIQRLVEKLAQQRRREIILDVREGNLPAQLFFREVGFQAIGVHKNHYDDSNEDAYAMRLALPQPTGGAA